MSLVGRQHKTVLSAKVQVDAGLQWPLGELVNGGPLSGAKTLTAPANSSHKPAEGRTRPQAYLNISAIWVLSNIVGDSGWVLLTGNRQREG